MKARQFHRRRNKKQSVPGRTRAKRPRISDRPQAQWPINISVARKRYETIRSIVSAVFRTTASNTSARTRRRRSLPRSESVSCSVLYSVVRGVDVLAQAVGCETPQFFVSTYKRGLGLGWVP